MVASALISSNTSPSSVNEVLLVDETLFNMGIETDGVKVEALVGISSSSRPERCA
jgi:hypothetical protein